MLRWPAQFGSADFLVFKLLGKVVVAVDVWF